MTCQLFEKQLSPYLDGELPAARAARLEAHLRTCPHCQAELRAMRGISHHIRGAGAQVSASPDFDQRVLRSVGYYQVTGPRKKRRAARRPMTLVVLLLAALLGILRHYLSAPPAPPVRAPQPAAAYAPAGQGAPVSADGDRR